MILNNNSKINPLMLTDTYNFAHGGLKCNVDWEVSHIYNRSAPMILYGFWDTVINTLDFKVTMKMIDEATLNAGRMNLRFPFELWDDVINKCGGIIPLKVEALSEGTWVPKGTPFAQISNTVEGFGELVTWFEGCFLHAYFPSACATEAFHMRRYLNEKTPNNPYRFHSFGFRGHRSNEDAFWASTAWALFLEGTDDFNCRMFIPNNVQVSSIIASAHKVVQQFDNEMDAYIHAIDFVSNNRQVYEKWPKLSQVIDTYDPWHFIRVLMPEVIQYAMSKQVHLVLRPDSGDPEDVYDQVAAILDFKNKTEIPFASKHVTVIIGENMTFKKAKDFDANLLLHNIDFETGDKIPAEEQYNINDVVYGIGGGFYDHISRSTLGWAMKTAYSNGKPRMKFSKNKVSLPGQIVLYTDNETRKMTVEKKIDELNYGDPYANLLQMVYYKGLCNRPRYDDTSIRAQSNLVKEDSELQDEIVLSADIIELIDRIRKENGIEHDKYGSYIKK